jgi:hypothetical protein
MHDKRYQRTLPAEIQSRIRGMETCQSAEKRLKKVLDKTFNDSILMTHEGPTGMFVTKYTGVEDSYLGRAGFIELQRFAGEWCPTYINNIELDSYAGKDI